MTAVHISEQDLRMEIYIANKALAKAQADINRFQELLNSRAQGCEFCSHYRDNVCRLAGGIAPPAEVVEAGCPEWVTDFIPF